MLARASVREMFSLPSHSLAQAEEPVFLACGYQVRACGCAGVRTCVRANAAFLRSPLALPTGLATPRTTAPHLFRGAEHDFGNTHGFMFYSSRKGQILAPQHVQVPRWAGARVSAVSLDTVYDIEGYEHGLARMFAF